MVQFERIGLEFDTLRAISPLKLWIGQDSLTPGRGYQAKR